jgi:hypothetical protein
MAMPAGIVGGHLSFLPHLPASSPAAIGAGKTMLEN